MKCVIFQEKSGINGFNYLCMKAHRMARIESSTLTFLKKLSVNNDRDWFNAHRNDYEKSKENVESFVNKLIAMMNTHDHIETPSARKSLYRIYNDVRFSEDKTPYNPRFAGHFRRMKPQLRGGYYYWIRPGNSRVGCGFVYPSSPDLARVRQDIDANFKIWKKLLSSRSITSTFGSMQGHQVETAPRGYPKDHPAIELLRFKQYWFETSFTDREVLETNFVSKVNSTFKRIRPFFDYMSDVLGTDGDGQPIYE